MTGQHKNAGKVRMTLVPTFAKWAVAKVMTEAAERGKYGLHDWRNGLFIAEQLDSLLRHAHALEAGEDIDPETNLPHAWLLSARSMMLCESMQLHPELDDRHCKLTDEEKSMGPDQLKAHLIERSKLSKREKMIQEVPIQARDLTIDLHPSAETLDLRPKSSTEVLPHRAPVVELPVIWIRKLREGWNRCERCGTEFLDLAPLVEEHKRCEMFLEASPSITETLDLTTSQRKKASGHE